MSDVYWKAFKFNRDNGCIVTLWFYIVTSSVTFNFFQMCKVVEANIFSKISSSPALWVELSINLKLQLFPMLRGPYSPPVLRWPQTAGSLSNSHQYFLQIHQVRRQVHAPHLAKNWRLRSASAGGSFLAHCQQKEQIILSKLALVGGRSRSSILCCIARHVLSPTHRDPDGLHPIHICTHFGYTVNERKPNSIVHSCKILT